MSHAKRWSNGRASSWKGSSLNSDDQTQFRRRNQTHQQSKPPLFIKALEQFFDIPIKQKYQKYDLIRYFMEPAAGAGVKSNPSNSKETTWDGDWDWWQHWLLQTPKQQLLKIKCWKTFMSAFLSKQISNHLVRHCVLLSPSVTQCYGRIPSKQDDQ